MIKIRLGSNEYDVEIGKELVLEDPEKIFGPWIKINTDEYEVTASRISVNGNINTFIVDKIHNTITGDTEVLFSESSVQVEPEPKHINFNKVKKAELIDIAAGIGFDTSINRTKKEWIELIESQIK